MVYLYEQDRIIMLKSDVRKYLLIKIWRATWLGFVKKWRQRTFFHILGPMYTPQHTGIIKIVNSNTNTLTLMKFYTVTLYVAEWCLVIATLTYLGYVQNLENYFLSVYIVCAMNWNNCHLAYIACYAMLIRVQDVLFFLTLKKFLHLFIIFCKVWNNTVFAWQLQSLY